jgi:hypothetical protein
MALERGAHVMHTDVRMARGAWMRRSGDALERLLHMDVRVPRALPRRGGFSCANR